MRPTNDSDDRPNWDVEQLEVILEGRSTWQLVTAEPGAGKSAVACQRIAHLVDDGIPPTRVLLVSFTRTAVGELRDRIETYAAAAERTRGVRISTIDSHAWSLRAGFDDDPFSTVPGGNSYDLNIERTIELFRRNQPDLCDFMSRLEHLIIDEAQDVMGVRADLVFEMLRTLSGDCGVTILADPAQAIYGFTTDDANALVPTRGLLDRLDAETPRPLLRRTLSTVHRIAGAEKGLANTFLCTRREIERASHVAGHVARVQQTIRNTCGHAIEIRTHENLPDVLGRLADDSTLVLFRRRSEVLSASSYCSAAGLEHRLRMSALPVVLRPWLGWLLGEFPHALISKADFNDLWDARLAVAAEPFAGEQRDACWGTLHRLSAGARRGTIDLVLLRSIVSRLRPPLDLCHSELGAHGPILGTIHASKGREADTVMLVMPSLRDPGFGELEQGASAVFEEGRVYYVGATRARRMLVSAGARAVRARHLDSNRVYRRLGPARAQVEVGRNGDVDRVAHLAWASSADVQRKLASFVGGTSPLKANVVPDADYAIRLILDSEGAATEHSSFEIGQLSESFRRDLNALWNHIDIHHTLRPAPVIWHLHLVAVTTVGLREEECSAVNPLFARSRLALAPVVKGFPLIQFLHRRRRARRLS